MQCQGFVHRSSENELLNASRFLSSEHRGWLEHEWCRLDANERLLVSLSFSLPLPVCLWAAYLLGPLLRKVASEMPVFAKVQGLILAFHAAELVGLGPSALELFVAKLHRTAWACASHAFRFAMFAVAVNGEASRMTGKVLLILLTVHRIRGIRSQVEYAAKAGRHRFALYVAGSFAAAWLLMSGVFLHHWWEDTQVFPACLDWRALACRLPHHEAVGVYWRPNQQCAAGGFWQRVVLVTMAPDLLLAPLTILLILTVRRQKKEERLRKASSRRFSKGEAFKEGGAKKRAEGKGQSSVTLAIGVEAALSVFASAAYASEAFVNEHTSPSLKVVVLAALIVATLAQKLGCLFIAVLTSKAFRDAVMERWLFRRPTSWGVPIFPAYLVVNLLAMCCVGVFAGLVFAAVNFCSLNV